MSNIGNKLKVSQKLGNFNQKLGDIINKKVKKGPKINNNNTSNITAGYKLDTNPFDYPITLTIIVIICLLFISYTVYKYYSDDKGLKVGSSYYGMDIANYVPLFEIQANDIEKCQNRCIRDPLCSGLTYNYDTQNCMGSEEGVLRTEKKNFVAWVKPKEFDNISAKSGMVLSYADKAKYVKNDKLIPPGIKGDYCYSFYITIFDFYDNFGSWRHVFHKGTPMKELGASGYDNDYKNWENVATDYPDQSIGVWLAPYTNNLRICYTMVSNQNTKSNSHVHAFIQKCNSLTEECYITDFPDGKKDMVNMIGDGEEVAPKLTKSLEFIEGDIQNIPLNTPIHVAVNFRINNVELYINGRLNKINGLQGTPEFNQEDVYVMYPKTFNGQITNLNYYSQSISQKKINELYDDKPKFN